MAYSIAQIMAENIKKELVSVKAEVVKLLDNRIEVCEKEIIYEQESIKNGIHRDRPR